MNTPWSWFIAAVVVLLPPLPFSSELRRFLGSMRRSQSASFNGAVRAWQNWADLVRGALGASFLSVFSSSWERKNPEDKLGLAAVAAVLMVVLLIQSVRMLRNWEIMAPLFFLSGITLMLGQDFSEIFTKEGFYWQGLFAVVVGWMFAIVGKNLNYQLPAMAVALGAAGYVLGLGTLLLLNCGLIIVPPLLATILRKRLVFVSLPATV